MNNGNKVYSEVVPFDFFEPQNTFLCFLFCFYIYLETLHTHQCVPTQENISTQIVILYHTLRRRIDTLLCDNPKHMPIFQYAKNLEILFKHYVKKPTMSTDERILTLQRLQDMSQEFDQIPHIL